MSSPSGENPAGGGASGEVTRILAAGRPAGSRESARLLELVYEQLHRLATVRMSAERPGHTLQPTALIHEAYARLVVADIAWSDRVHFFSAAAEAMRRILVDHARSRGRVKEGGRGRAGTGGTSGTEERQGEKGEKGAKGGRVPLDLVELAEQDDPAAILSVDEAFGRLQALDEGLARVVQLRFFAGLSEAETALALGVSDRTVRRDWTMARAWMRRWLEEDAGRPI